MEHKFSAIISSCIIAFMMASCTVSTHTTTRTPPPPPPAHHYGHPHYGHPHPGPGPKRYPIDQFRKGPAPQHHKGIQAPPPPAKNNIRDVERNGVRNNGTEPSQRKHEQQSVRGGSTQQRSTQSSSSTTRSQRSGSSSTSTPSTGRSGGRR